MTTLTLSLIAAIDQNRVMAKSWEKTARKQLPWYIPEDSARFMKLTKGHPVIMGRTTYESMPNALPDRPNIIITHDKMFNSDDCIVAHSPEEAFVKARELEQENPTGEIFVAGGSKIFEAFINQAEVFHLTLVHGNFEGDVFFPDYSRFNKVLSSEKHTRDGYTYEFVELGI